jgi:hypothetical protein
MAADPTAVAHGLHHIVYLAGSNSATSPGTVTCTTGYACLPAWRWAGFSHSPSFNVNLGFGDVFDQIIDPIGQVLFWIANFWWSILMALVQIVASFDIVGTTNFANTINKSFHDIGAQLNSTGLIFGVALAGIFGAMWKAARRGHQHGLRAAIRVLLPLGILIAMTEAAAGHTNDAAKTASNGTEITAAVGTPAWVIQKLQTEVDVAGGWLATAVTPNNANLVPDQSDTRTPACTTYMSVLNKSGEAALSSSANSSVASASFLPETVSYLWEQTYLPVWTSAQFGNSGLGDRVACHYLDMVDSVQPQQQAAIGAAAGYPPNVDWAPTSYGPGGVYGPLSNASQYTQDIYAWSMCVYNGKQWTDATDYQALDVGNNQTWASVATKACNDWWTNGVGIYTQHWDTPSGATDGLPNCGGGTCNPFALTTGGKIQAAVYGNQQATSTPQATAYSQDAFDFMTDFEGHNAGGMLMGGIVVNIVSLALVWALAGLCLGVVIAGFAIFILAMLLPLLLLGMALASDHQHMAKRGFKMGISMMASKGVMMVLLGLLVLFINAVQNAWTIPPGEGSIGTAFLNVLPPVAGLAVLSMLAKRVLGISLMNPLSASRLGWSMAQEADRGWGGPAGALEQRLAGHRNPFVRSAFGGGMMAAAGGALGAFEMDRLMQRHNNKRGVERGAGTELNPAAMATARRSGQRAGKTNKGLGGGASNGPTVPGGRLSGFFANRGRGGTSAQAGGAAIDDAATGLLDDKASRNVALLGPDGKTTWGTRAAALRQELNKDALKGKLARLPQSLAGRYKQLEQRHGKLGAAVGMAGSAAALGAGIAFAPSLALAAGYAGLKATNRLTDRSVQIGRHINSLYGRATNVLDRQLGLIPNNTGEPVAPNGSSGAGGRLTDEADTHSPADARAYVEAMRTLISEPSTSNPNGVPLVNTTTHTSRPTPEPGSGQGLYQQPTFTDTGSMAPNQSWRDEELAAMAETPQPSLPPSSSRISQQYIEQQRGTFDDQGRWVKTVPNSPDGTRAGRRQTPRGRNSHGGGGNRQRPQRRTGGNQQNRAAGPQQALPPPPDRGSHGGSS